ncbi:MAG TPA: hypothetical protein VJZ74_05655, partial [Pseudolabrys sp.]|nr:hypothetical protein [Pseudolabrys sp.]
TMRIGRAILVALLAVAVAAPPVVAGYAAQASTASSAMAVVVEAAPDGEHQHELPCDKTQSPSHTTQLPSDTIHKNAAGCAGCAFKCFKVYTVAFASVVFVLSVGTEIERTRTIDHVCSLMGTPPFRPPRA